MYLRQATQQKKPRTAQQQQFPAPTGGWISNRARALPQGAAPGAALLDNFFPRSGGVKLRRGKQLYTTLPSTSLAVGALFSYKNGNTERLFAANQTNIYNVTTTTPASVMGSLTSADWTAVQFATTGGVFLIGVNGANNGFIFNGTTFTPNTGVTFGTSGLSMADMSFVWVFKNRLWFAQKDSLAAWYLPVDSIAGTAVAFPLAGVFGLGGALVFGQDWSLGTSDQGGLGEQCIFVTTQGEVAIYQGVDPAAAATWSKVGVYRIGTPLGKRAFIRGGGDIAIATSVGLVPLSKAIELDVTSLNIASVSYNIADAWDNATTLRGLANWQCQLWPEQKMAIVSPPDLIGSSQPVLFVSNTETGAWCRYTGWYAMCMEVFRGQLYFGSPNGEIFLGNVSGLDGDQTYSGACIPLHEDLGTPGSLKIATVSRAVTRANTRTNGKITASFNFSVAIPPAPDATSTTGGNVWGVGIWGQSVWAQGTPTFINELWRSVAGSGYTTAPCYQVTSGSVFPLDEEVISMQVTWLTAEIVT